MKGWRDGGDRRDGGMIELGGWAKLFIYCGICIRKLIKLCIVCMNDTCFCNCTTVYYCTNFFATKCVKITFV